MEKKNVTNEFSFILKQSKCGIGVFATHDIEKDTFLRLFGKEEKDKSRARVMKKKDVPDIFREYCADRGDELLCPKDFGEMSVGWYLNHSKDSNAYHKDYLFYAFRDIRKGEEIFIDYNSLEEPEETKDDYYFRA